MEHQLLAIIVVGLSAVIVPISLIAILKSIPNGGQS